MLVKMIKLDCYSVKSTTFYNTQAITDCKVIMSCFLSSHRFRFLQNMTRKKRGECTRVPTRLSLLGIKRSVETLEHPVTLQKKVTWAGLTREDGRMCCLGGG